MKTYTVTYTDCGDSQQHRTRAYDAEHAAENFWDMILEWQGSTHGIQIQTIRTRNK